MMTIYLSTIGCVLLLWGGLFIIRAIKSRNEPTDNVVPITDLSEIEELAEEESKPSADLVKSPSLLTQHMVDQNLKASTESSESMPAEKVVEDQTAKVEELENQISELNRDNARLKQLAEDMGKAPTLEDIKKIQVMRKVNEELQEEKKVLNEALDENTSKIEQLEKKVLDLGDNYKKSLKEREETIKSLDESVAQLKSDKQLSQTQTDQFVQLEAENQQLLGKIESFEQQKQQLEDKVRALESSEALKASEENKKASDQLAQAKEMVESLNKEREDLLQVKDDFDLKYNKLKNLNSLLIDKEKMLQYELTKSRAKALGLEKICEDFQYRIEEKANS